MALHNTNRCYMYMVADEYFPTLHHIETPSAGVSGCNYSGSVVIPTVGALVAVASIVTIVVTPINTVLCMTVTRRKRSMTKYKGTYAGGALHRIMYVQNSIIGVAMCTI